MGWCASDTRSSPGGRRAACRGRSGRRSSLDLLDRAILPRADRGLDHFLRRQTVVARRVERPSCLHLLDEGIDPVAEGVVEAAHAAHDRVLDYQLVAAVAREELEPLEDVFDHEATLAA